MSSEGIQITIPADFDEDEFQSTPISFERAGMFGIGSASGSESPIVTPTTAIDRGFFGAHTRGDSLASDDSFFDHAPRKPFAHTSQSSIATTATSTTAISSAFTSTGTSTSTSPFGKKPSFASIRNAFKSSSKNTADVPPVPSLDHHPAYPILKNPFNRSTSSLAHSITANSKQANATSPPHQQPRPPTPASNESRPPRSSSRARGHSTTRSHHSQSGSIFHSSDNGSDHGHSFAFGHHPANHAFAFGHPPSSPPPVPRVPDVLVASRSDSPVPSEESLSAITSGPRNPSDCALHAVLIRFATLAEAKIDVFLRVSSDNDPILTDFFGPALDPQFDDLLRSLGKLAQRHAKNVVDSIMRWRRGINDGPVSSITTARSRSSPHSRTVERRSLASIYIMCRALIAILSTLPPHALSDTLGYSLEETTFEQFRRPLASTNANYRLCAELYAGVLGCLAGVRFVSVTDRFLHELAPVASGHIAKDLDTKFENLVMGLRYVQIKVWPPEAFEEGAEFMESLAKSFENAHGLRFKTAFAETVIRLLHPIGKTAQAEVNHPQWAKAVEKIYPRAKDMISKPRYWHVAYPLAVTALCVAPHQYFLKNWMACFEYGISKLKDKPYRLPIMNGMVRLIWTYLYRCQEPTSTTTAKLDGLLKHFFPAGRALIYAQEEHLEPFICIVHFIMSRYFEYGRDVCIDLLHESGSTTGVPAPERVGIVVQATLLTLHGIEREEPTPTWPSSLDFSAVPSWDDYPSSSEILPPAVLSKPGIQDFFERFGAAISTIAQICFKAVGDMSVFDDQWSLARSSACGSSSFEESHNVVIRRHPEGAFAYPSNFAAQISVLQTCYQSWPRCLPTSSLPLTEAMDMLLRGVIHVEPRVGEVSAAALRRIMKDSRYGLTVVKCFTAFLFDSKSISAGTGTRIILESARLLNLWYGVVDSWISELMQAWKQESGDSELQTVVQQLDAIAAGTLFLLSHEMGTIRCTGVKLTRLLLSLSSHIASDEPTTPGANFAIQFPVLFQYEGSKISYLEGFDDLLDRSELDRLQQWRKAVKSDVLLRIADSNNEKDRKIWRYIYPSLIRASLSRSAGVASDCRAIIAAAASRYHSTMLLLAGISASSGRLQSSRTSEREGYKQVKESMPLIDQWHVWIKTLCSTVAVSDSRSTMAHAGREHSRVPSESSFERERLSTARCLFKYLTPFLDSDYTPFRDSAVLCISSFPPEAYPQLLEDLNLFASRHFYDEVWTKAGTTSTRSRRQGRLHSAVARIYYLTAPHLQHQKASAKQDALSHALKFVRNTQAFLIAPENRDNYALQRLRRYFCGLVERLFDTLAGLPDSDRFTFANIQLILYRLCEEWCQYGVQTEATKQRFILMQRAAAAINDPHAESDAGERFQHETKLLSNATVGALASLCQKACFPCDTSESTTPIDRLAPELTKPLEAVRVLERIHAILETGNNQLGVNGRKALRSLLVLPQSDPTWLGDVLRHSFCDPASPTPSSFAFLEVVADVICNVADHSFTFAQVVALGLANLCHGDIVIRRHAFDILVAIHERSAGVIAMAEFEIMIVNSAPSVYLQAHRLIAECLAGEHPKQAFDVLSEVAALLQRIHRNGNWRVSHLMLQSLEHWMPNLHVNDPDKPKLQLTPEGGAAVYHLLALTKRYNDAQPEQIAAIWARLVEVPDPQQGRSIASFLVNESLKVATNAFVKCASEVVGCLSRSSAGAQIFEELCSICGPERMLPSLDHRLQHLTPQELELWSDLDVLFADDQPRYFLGSAQYAMVFIGSVALERLWTYHEQIPVILQAVLSHIDHRVSMLRNAARRMLVQLMRSCIPRYSAHADKVGYSARSALLSVVATMEEEGDSLFWTENDADEMIHARMKYLVDQILSIIGQFVPDLAKNLGALAIPYLEHCPIRSIALRSLQVYQLLRLPLTQEVLGHLLVRLGTTISDEDDELHHFATGIITTLAGSAETDDLDRALLPRLFWTASACLMTVVEGEFLATVKFLNVVLSKIDLDDPKVVDLILAECPSLWSGMRGLQACLLGGMRSATTMNNSFAVLHRLAKISDSRVIDDSGCRVRDLFTLSLPHCLHAMATDSHDGVLDDFCGSVANLASQEGRDTISRIMTSFVKRRFRTKDDFLRQSITGLREHYGVNHWPNIATLLLGFVLNEESWLRIHTMQVLKVLFQQKDPRNDQQSLTTEHLMPLLRLVEGDFATQALEVLEEPIKIYGGVNSKQILRMSMHTALNTADADEGEVFGVPEESGWCISQAKSQRSLCRDNVLAVARTCISALRPSFVTLESRTQIVSYGDALDEDLGVLVQDLHELSEFLQNTRPHPRLLLPSQQLEERVASIIARSTDSSDAPQTPFTDVFQIGKPRSDSDNSDDDSDSDSGLDAFVYDSSSFYHSGPNGHRLG
ncbi:cell morphogenesis N-terminal-domain-containing protein [Phlebopus sp. FC_14]|nr:cell morphogenesis N-terminal-domain-containing protein [Phlebopus sp. FC_14]